MKLYSRDIGMESCIEKCSMFIMRSEKRQIREGIELLNEDKIKTFRDNEIYKYLEILQVDTIK